MLDKKMTETIKEYVFDIRIWKIPKELGDSFYIAEAPIFENETIVYHKNRMSMTTIKVEPKDYVAVLGSKYQDKQLYEHINVARGLL